MGVAADPVAELQVELTGLLVRHEGEASFVETDIRRATGVNTYLTSGATAPWDRQRVLVATTFHGLYESPDGGATWVDLGEAFRLTSLYRGSGFYEDISAAAYDPADQTIWWVELATTGETVAIDVESGGRVSRPVPNGVFDAVVRAPDPPQVERSAARLARREAAADHVSFYLNPQQVSPERLAGHMAFARQHGFTAVVVDFKDDFGRITYETDLEPHHSIGAVRGFFDADRVIQTIQDAGLYVIARVVVFKDRELAESESGRLSVWDSRRNAPWGVFRDGEQIEYWVDLFSQEVWDYNIAIARDLEARGVDEIQFDYIRTPSDGRVRDIEFRFHDQSPALVDEDPWIDDRVEALTAFLRRARTQISIPIGIDVFGFNGWYRMSYLGQDIAALAPYIDVISPMLYPSHFGRDFATEFAYIPRGEYLYRSGTERARRITGDAVLIRPYVQAFLIGNELQMEEPEYTEYLKRQIRGALDAGASGYTLWNASGRYYMVARGLD